MEPDESSIISKLESSSELSHINSLISSHLQPFDSLLNPPPTAKKPSKSKPSDTTSSTIRPLAKQFLSFISKSLSLIPKRLSESPKIPQNYAHQLFDAYDLCLKCLGLLAPVLSGKPHAVEVHRLRYLHCLESWEMYGEAEKEGEDLLRGFRELRKGKSKRLQERLVPELDLKSVDQEIVVIILEIVVTLVKCGAKRKSKVGADYYTIISLVHESEEWFKALDSKDYDRFHRFLVTNLHITAQFLVADMKCFHLDLILEFLSVTFKEYKRSSILSQMYKLSLKACSSLFSQRDELSNESIVVVLKYLLASFNWQAGLEDTSVGFLELVCYCANRCRGATLDLCGPVAEHLSTLAVAFRVDFPSISTILMLYGAGLLASSSKNQLKCESTENCRHTPLGLALRFWFDKMEWHQLVSGSLESMVVHCEFCGSDKNSHDKGMAHARFNWDAVKFFTQLFAEAVYSDWKYILSETESLFRCEDLSKICEVFHHFSNIYLHHLSECSSTERDRETSGDNHRAISSVVVASLIISLKTNQKVKVSTGLVEKVIMTDRIPFKRLKYLYVALNNIVVILNRKNQLIEAIEALELCCKAIWNHIVHLCKMHVDKSHVAHEDVSEKSIMDLVKEASEKTAFFLELTNQEGGYNINSLIVESLTCWSTAEKLICGIPTPVSFIKKFVKIECLLSKNVEVEHGRTLYSLLQSFTGSSKRSLGRLLEQELCLYKEVHLNLRFCLRMRIKIIDILLEDIYNTEESNLEKSRILIEKAKVLRAHGLERVKECMQCLEAAMSTLELLKMSRKSQAHHLLSHAYLMRALCTMDSMSNFIDLSPKSCFLQDIQTAVGMCLSTVYMHADDECAKSEDMLYLWYQLIDFLSVKGYLDLHPSMYNVVIKLFGQKNFSLDKTVSSLWKNRRFSHGLCPSPINHKFITTFSEHQIQINSTGFWRNCMEQLNPTVAGFHQTDDMLKQAASKVGSQGPLSSSTIFFSSQLFYDLSGRLISRGCMVEALSYAKEAHRLRSILLQQNFEYSVEKVTETLDEGGKIIEKSNYAIQSFKVKDTFINDRFASYEGCSLTPWNVLSCYLESLLQVGVIQEILGSGTESEMLLRCGRNISQFQGLPLFESSFSSMLGKLYRKQKLWCIAEKELRSAEKILADNSDTISCDRCACMLEISINHQITELLLNSSCSSGESHFAKRLSDAGCLYRSALHKLNLSKLWDFISEEGTADQLISKESSTGSRAIKVPDSKRSISTRPRRTKKEAKPATQRHDMVANQNRRITRSSHRSLTETLESAPSDRKSAPSAGFFNEHLSSSAARPVHSGPDSKDKLPATEFQSAITCLCNKIKCWHCVYGEATSSSSINNFIHMNWEVVYRKVLLRLLVGIGKFSNICGNYHEAKKVLLQSLSVLLNKNSACSEYSSSSLICLIETIGKHFPGDLLAADRAALIYYICWFILKCFRDQGTRDHCCEISCIETTEIFSLLKLAFVLSQEVPALNQKIARLLAVLYVLSSSMKSLSLIPSEEGFESRWASFFHQASLGTHLVQHIHSDLLHKRQDSVPSDSEGFLLENSISQITERLSSLRLSSESSKCLNASVQRFFDGLPSTPVICISLVVGVDAGLLSELLQCSSNVQAWILLSHLSSDDQHVILLPLHETLKELSEDDASSSLIDFDCEKSKRWTCPWGSCVIDDIAPVFRHVLEGNYYSSSDHFFEHIKGNNSLWWSRRKRLDNCLAKFLQDMEDLWLGAWKYLLLGEWPDHNYLESVRKNLFGGDTHPLQHVLSKNCFVGLRPDASSDSSGEFDSTIQFLYRRTLKKSHNHDQVECVSTKPIILVLDFEVQMLPWESLPILRDREVYRMPSVGSICLTIDRCCEKERNENSIPAFPLIDPLDSYYLLNPDGDLHRTQAEFEDWFKIQNIQGKTGTAPTIEELAVALKSHDLFIYFGHGSGMQYIPGYEIEKLNNCAATLLLGCSSGSLQLKGCYMPHGAPISYLQAGSPVIIANLWDVTDKDIDRFGKAMLNSWLREREAASAACSECDVSKNCVHRQRIGSFMPQARDACNLGYLIGAAPVCYGVPTGIVKRKNV